MLLVVATALNLCGKAAAGLLSAALGSWKCPGLFSAPCPGPCQTCHWVRGAALELGRGGAAQPHRPHAAGRDLHMVPCPWRAPQGERHRGLGWGPPGCPGEQQPTARHGSHPAQALARGGGEPAPVGVTGISGPHHWCCRCGSMAERGMKQPCRSLGRTLQPQTQQLPLPTLVWRTKSPPRQCGPHCPPPLFGGGCTRLPVGW